MNKEQRLIVRVDDWLSKEIEKKLKSDHITISEIVRLLLKAWVLGDVVIKVEQKSKKERGEKA